MTDYSDPKAWPYVFELIHVGSMFIDDRYQRPVTSIADKIAGGFNLALMEPLLVAPRGKGKYAIADGQNRWAGAKRIGHDWLWCRVMKMTPQEEARVFSLLQSERKNIRPLERFKADVFSGDSEAVAVKGMLDRHHITTTEASGAYGTEDSLAAITAVRRGWNRYGEEQMDEVFETIRAGFPGERGRYSGELISALARFLDEEEGVNKRRLFVALSEEIGTVKELSDRSTAKRRGSGMGGGSVGYTVRVIREAYGKVGRGAFRKQWEDVK